MFEESSPRERVTESSDTEQLRAAVYARTSSKSQEFGYSLDAQVQQSVRRCESLGWAVCFIFRDEAESGKNTDRPMFRKMLNAAEKQAFDVVVFWKLDRFSRSLMHAVQLESKLREHDVRLYSVTEQIDTTSATGRFNFRNIASAAEFERDMIQQRTKMGYHQLASEFRWPNGSPPLGYELDSDNRLVVIDNEAELVVDIFRMYIERRSMPDVAQRLNEKGLSTKSGGTWTPRAVGDLLSNPIYKGRYEVADVSEYVPEFQIVDTDLFEEVKSIRHRFQTGNESKSPMSDSRKNQAISRMREMYREFRAGNRVGHTS